MARIVKGGLIQASSAVHGADDLSKIEQAVIDKHVPPIEEAGRQELQVPRLQEVSYGPYFYRDRRPDMYASRYVSLTQA